MAAAILALNAGSSSVKLALFDRDRGGRMQARLRGSLSGIGGDASHFQVKDAQGEIVADQRWPEASIEQVTDRLLAWIDDHLGDHTLAGVGHRVLHGGRAFSAPVLIDPEILACLDALTPLAPLHQPANLAPIRHLVARRPELPQVACFDTAFHHGIGAPASRYALPRALEADGIRRYGFHGLSYEAIAGKLRAIDDGALSDRIIVAHLGNGASLCAMSGLQSVDTTMGFTALDGIMMGTRPGALDPGILLYLMQAKGYDAARIEHLLYHESGLLGVSGGSSDVAALLASDRREAREALDLFAFLVARHAAALAATLGGLDRFVFTGGIGEHAWQVRAMIADRLAWMGARLDAEANRAGSGTISHAGAGLRLQVIATDEEGVIAAHVATLLDRP
ncbi:acetate/propionate family kinase [soil metagenome]